jgi:NAD(P)H dehydrogenase (quinone)
MTNVAIVYHSGYGHTAKLAQAVADGAARVPGTHVNLISTDEVEQHWHNLDSADAIVFGTPTYMGGPSAAFKGFMEKTARIWFEQKWQDKLAAGFTNSASQNGDKLNTLVDLAVFAAQHGMHWINLGLLPGNNSSKGSVEDLNRLGSFLGAMSQSNNDQGPDVAPIASDLRTAASLGERMARTAQQFTHRRERKVA